MKNLLISTLILLLTLTLSCTNGTKNKISVADKIDQTENKSFLSANIDGKKFYTNDVKSFLAYNIITLAAVSEDKTEKIRIYINYNNGSTTYTFGKGISNSDNMVYTNNKTDWLAAKIKGNGTITFTEKGEYLMGKFSFTGVSKDNQSTKQITNGEFKIRIQK